LAFGLEARALPLRSAYVTNTSDDTVSVISLDTNAVVGTINVGDQPGYVAVTPDGLRAYVSNRNSNNVSVIDAISGSVIQTIGVGTTPLQLAVDRTG
jgi:YVTN family beta-propeller protein